VTLDVAHLANAEQVLRTAWAYRGVDVLLSHRLVLPHLPSDIRFLELKEADLRDTGLGAYIGRDGPPRPFLLATARGEDPDEYTEVGLEEMPHLQRIASQFSVPMETVTLAESHQALGRNLLVSDDPEMQKLRSWYGRDRKQHIITSTELTPALTRLQRRRGIYYTSPHNTVNKGLYYRRELLRRVPSFDAVWATAIYAMDAPTVGLPQELVGFVDSIGDRIMILIELRNEIELQAEDAPNNDSEWDIVNKLNYFFMLVTGLLDNLAWVALARHGQLAAYLQSGKRNNVSLQMRDKQGSIGSKPFNNVLKQMDQRMYDHVQNHQDLIAVFYPVRDAIQHRTVLSGTRLQYLDGDWASTMVHFDSDTVAAIQVLDPARPYDLNLWGLFQFDDLVLVQPDAFSRQALDRVLEFTQTFLDILDMPALLVAHPTLKAQVDQDSPEVRRLLAR